MRGKHAVVGEQPLPRPNSHMQLLAAAVALAAPPTSGRTLRPPLSMVLDAPSFHLSCTTSCATTGSARGRLRPVPVSSKPPREQRKRASTEAAAAAVVVTVVAVHGRRARAVGCQQQPHPPLGRRCWESHLRKLLLALATNHPRRFCTSVGQKQTGMGGRNWMMGVARRETESGCSGPRQRVRQHPPGAARTAGVGPFASASHATCNLAVICYTLWNHEGLQQFYLSCAMRCWMSLASFGTCFSYSCRWGCAGVTAGIPRRRRLRHCSSTQRRLLRPCPAAPVRSRRRTWPAGSAPFQSPWARAKPTASPAHGPDTAARTAAGAPAAQQAHIGRSVR